MIKGFRFVTRREDVTAEAFAAEWPGAVAAAMQAPPEVRPTRLAVCTVLPESDPGPRHDGVEIGWFDDGPHLRRFRGWVGTSRGWSVLKGLDRVVDFDASPVVVAKETALRGADWLGHRWRDGGARFKHMAVAVRAEGLTPAEFAERWRAHAGQVRKPGSEAATAIPDTVRGLAYVQNHPVPRSGGEWAYDAVNEVYCDDAESLRARIAWFRDEADGGADGALFGRSWFLAVKEEIVPAP
ncbi:EthD domain-containing protein [Actinocorallia libanotica]|uniref:EthD domain-containing protein n=1 Tax=Actinocorallia libanotica TaxID=46162 RepID=A0ABN1QZN7_9ACTN